MDLGFYSPGPLSLCLQKGGLGSRRFPALQKHLPSQAERPTPPLSLLGHTWPGTGCWAPGPLCREKSALERRVLETTRYSITSRRRLWALLNPRRKNINLIQLPLFPWCCVAKIKIKPLLFNGQKAKPYNLPFRRRQWCAPVSGWCALADWSRGQSCKSRGECVGKGNSHFLARSWRQGKSGISGFLVLPRKGSEFPPRLVPWHLPCILLKWHPRFVAR